MFPSLHAALRANLPYFAIGCVVLVAGLCMLLLSRAVPIALVTRQTNWADSLNSILVTSGTLLLLLHLLLKRDQATSFAKSLTVPLVVCGIFVLLENRGVRP